MLNGSGREFGADAREHRLPVLARIAEYADLDQLVRGEIDVDLVQHCRREPVVADADDRMQLMRFRTKRAAQRG